MVPDIDALLSAVARFNQDRRLLRVKSNLDDEALMVQRFDGREEVSQPFDLRLTLLSPYAHLELKSIVGQTMRLSMTTHVDTERHFHGYVREFARVGADGGFVRYEARIAPWFWFLSQRSDCRIFQDSNVIDIARQVFEHYGALAQVRYDVSEAQYPKLPYCVQYNESDFAFVSRLLEDAGIHYRFEHTEDQHTLVLSDDSTQCPPQPDDANIRFHGDQGTLAEDVMDDWTARRRVATTERALKTYDFKQPTNPLQVSHAAEIPRGLLPPLEAYEYDGAASYVDAMVGDQRANVRMQELAWRAKIYEGRGTSRLMQPGFYFTLDDHFEHAGEAEDDRQFFALSVVHEAHNNFLRNHAEAEPAVYRGEVSCIRRKLPFRPTRSPAPRMPGPQTATVVGPPGEELYADRFGRVKVQFHWDRLGQRDESSSCYVRVASPWAGEGMGGVSIPRVGQEVVVDFLDGNPDRPIIVGRVFNNDNMPPFGLEVSGIRSKTVKGGGYNEMTMHDSPGAQLLNLQAERNMDTLVKNDQNNTVQSNKTTSVGVDHTENVGANQTTTVGANQAFTVKANRTASVMGNDARTVDGSSASNVTGAVTQNYGATQARSVASHYTESIGGNWGSQLGGNYTGTVGGNWADTVAGSAAWTVAGNVTETLRAGRQVIVTGVDVRHVTGPVNDSNVGARDVSVNGALSQTSTATSALHANADMSVTSNSTVKLGVGGSGITIEGGAIVISSNGATIKVDASGVTINGSKINLNA